MARQQAAVHDLAVYELGGGARSVTLVPLALDHIARSESDLDSTLTLSKAEGTVLVPHAADGLPRRNRYRGAYLRRIRTLFLRFSPTWGWTSSNQKKLKRKTAHRTGTRNTQG